MDVQIWKEYYKPPFVVDNFDPGIIWDAEGHMVASPRESTMWPFDTVAGRDPDSVRLAVTAIVDAINARSEGREPKKTVHFDKAEYSEVSVKFSAFGFDLGLFIRGWGYLTGYLRLKDESAMLIQDSLGNFMAESIRKASKEPEASA